MLQKYVDKIVLKIREILQEQILIGQAKKFE